VWSGAQPCGLALDEAHHRTDMTTPVALASGGSILLVLLLGWRVCPRPEVRSTTTSNCHRWPWFAAGAASAFVSPVLGLVAVVTPLIWRRWASMRRRARVTRQVAHDFPDALDLFVLSIRAGYLPAQAIVEVVAFLPPSLRSSFVAVGDALQRRDRFADALGQLRTALGPIAQPLADSLSAAERYGLALAPVLERLSLEARQQRRRDTDATARELPVRLAMPLVLCTLPSFVLLAIVPLLLGALSSLHT